MFKKLVSMMFSMALIIVISVSCSSNSADNNQNHNNVVNTSNQQKEISKQETKKDMTSAELDEALKNQPVSIVKTEYRQSEKPELKALYSDILLASFQNNSGVDIKDVVLGFVAWDVNNLPVRIKDKFDFTDGEYFKQVNFDGINLINGEIHNGEPGLDISNENIAKFKVIVISYADFDGNTWNNPLLGEFKKLYVDKRLTE